MPKYPNPCCRCGFCCLAETCIVAQSYYKIGKYDSCPALSFNGDFGKCALVEKGLVPVGCGCCISARCIKDGIQYDFASLPPEIKKTVVRKINRQTHLLVR